MQNSGKTDYKLIQQTFLFKSETFKSESAVCLKLLILK